MYTISQNCFRKDLIVTETTNKETLVKCHLVKDPISGETFEFGEEEYFLCQSMDGKSTIPEILAAFERRFGLSLTEENFKQFSAQITEFGLLESYKDQEPSYLPDSLDNKQSSFLQTNTGNIREEDPEVPAEHKIPIQNKKNGVIKWNLSNPEGLFIFFLSLFKPFKILFNGLTWLLIPSTAIAFLTFFKNQPLFWRDLVLFVKPLPLVQIYFLNMVIVNLTTKLGMGVVYTYYGGTVKEFGIKLAFGILPRFYLHKRGILRLKREEQLWTFATPIIVRFYVFILGILTWYWTRETETGLKTFALVLGHMGLLEFLLEWSPFWLSDGYGWLMAYFGLSPKFKQNSLIWEMMVNRRPLPKHLTTKEKLRLQLFSLLMVVVWGFLAFRITHHIALGLLKSISPGILSEGAKVVLICVPFGLALRWWLMKQSNVKTSNNRRSKLAYDSRLIESPNQVEVSEWSVENRPIAGKKLISISKRLKSWARNLVKLFLLVGLGILLFSPYPYRPGGSIQLLPPTQQQIQAQVEGKITQVFFKGGDGQWLKAGRVIANMEAVDIENTVLTTQAQVRQQQAELEKQQANLKKLLATPKKEDVAVAKQQVEAAKQQIEVAKQQVEVAKGKLQTAITKAEFSARQAGRFQELYQTGAFSLQQYENAKKEAETDRNTIEEQKQNLEETKQNVLTKQQNLQTVQANLELVRSGPYPQEIEAARQEVEAARANLNRLQQQLKYNQEQIQRTPLVMPIDGYIVTSFLDRKVGSYLKQGETFAVVEDNRNIRGEIQIPEYNVGEFEVGAKVEVKLLAYPDKPLFGKVVSIEPTTSTQATDTGISRERTSNSSEKFITVILDIPNTEKTLKAGMSGYAKIEGRTMPFIVAFTRPIVRFVQIEIWSWLP